MSKVIFPCPLCEELKNGVSQQHLDLLHYLLSHNLQVRGMLEPWKKRILEYYAPIPGTATQL